MVRLKQTAKWIKRFTLLGLVLPAAALAAQSQSSSYQVNEVFFGTGGELHACSSTFCAKQAAGETAIGNTAGTADQAQAGFNTDRQPYLEMTVTAGYNTCGLFKYVKGDTIASSSKSSGETDYTISYIFNISPTTPGGTYSMNHVLVAVGGF
jgi:hypothetical protein